LAIKRRLVGLYEQSAEQEGVAFRSEFILTRHH